MACGHADLTHSGLQLGTQATHLDVGLDFSIQQALGSGFDSHSAEDKMGLLPWWEEGGGLRRETPLILYHL